MDEWLGLNACGEVGANDVGAGVGTDARDRLFGLVILSNYVNKAYKSVPNVYRRNDYGWEDVLLLVWSAEKFVKH